jgi:DNA modification methylase
MTWQIIEGDCIQVLTSPTTVLPQIHALVMDPPYASGARTEAAKPSSGAMVRGARWAAKPIENDQMTTTGFIWLMRETLIAVKPYLAPGAAILSFIDWRQWPNLVGAVESVNMRVNGMVVWDKESMGLGNGFRAQHELILYASNGSARVIDRGMPNVLRHKRDSNANHPSPKPIPLMEDLLRVVTDEGDVVLDTFAGSGSTLMAALRLGRVGIGIESSPDHCRTARERLAAEEAGSTLEASRAGQLPLLGGAV